MENDGSKFLERLGGLLKDGQYSDFTIRCQGESWALHRILVSAHSPVFERMFISGFMEANDGEVDLTDDDPKLVGAMIKFMYCLAPVSAPIADGYFHNTLGNPCRDPWSISNDTGLILGMDIRVLDSELGTAWPERSCWHQNRLLFDAKLYSLADKYNIEALETSIERDFSISLGYLSANIDCAELKLIPEITAAVYEGTPKTRTSLRALLLSFFEDKKRFIFGRESLRAYAKKNPDFMTDYLNLCIRASSVTEFWLWCWECNAYRSRDDRKVCGWGEEQENHEHKFADACPES